MSYRIVVPVIALAIVISIAAGGLFYPQINEVTPNACGAFQVRIARIVGDSSKRSPDEIAEVIAAVSDGARSHALVKHKYPNLPPSIGCVVAYYDLMRNPNSLDDEDAGTPVEQSQSSARSPKIAENSPAQVQEAFAGGKYHRANPSSDMTITRNGELWHIVLDGAGPDLGEQTPADCHLEAEGQLVGDKIDAAVVPFRANESEFSEEDIKSNPGIVRVKLSSSAATVTEATVEGFCGRHSDLTGGYLQDR